MVIVSLIKVGCEVRSFDVSDDPTLGNLLDKAGEPFIPNTITINTQNIVTEESRLCDCDRIFIGNKVKGNTPFIVDFIRLGQGQVISVSSDGNQTIGQCIEMMTAQNRASFIDSDGREKLQYQISGVPKQSSDIVPGLETEGGTVRVICAMKVKGN